MLSMHAYRNDAVLRAGLQQQVCRRKLLSAVLHAGCHFASQEHNRDASVALAYDRGCFLASHLLCKKQRIVQRSAVQCVSAV
jgi:hypothetical protein